MPRTTQNILALALLLSAACGVDDDEPCGPLDGIYRVVYRERTGDCGDFDSLASFSADDELDPDCTGRRRQVSACDLEIDVTCPALDDLGRHIGYVTMVSSLSMSQGNRRLEGSVSFTSYSTSMDVECRGSGTLTYTKQ